MKQTGIIQLSILACFSFFHAMIWAQVNLVDQNLFDQIGTARFEYVDYDLNKSSLAIYSVFANGQISPCDTQTLAIGQPSGLHFLSLDSNYECLSHFNFIASSTVGYNAFNRDESGHIYLGGTFVGVVDFDPSPQVHELENDFLQNSYDGFIQKLNALGELEWVHHYTATDAIEVTQIENIGDSILIVGNFKAYANLGWNGDSILVYDDGIGAQNKDLFVQMIDGNGQLLWTQVVPASNSITVDEVLVSGENILLTGELKGQADFDQSSGLGQFTPPAQGTVKHKFVTLYSTAGAYKAHKVYSALGEIEIQASIFNEELYIHAYSDHSYTIGIGNDSMIVSGKWMMKTDLEHRILFAYEWPEDIEVKTMAAMEEGVYINADLTQDYIGSIHTSNVQLIKDNNYNAFGIILNEDGEVNHYYRQLSSTQNSSIKAEYCSPAILLHGEARGSGYFSDLDSTQILFNPIGGTPFMAKYAPDDWVQNTNQLNFSPFENTVFPNPSYGQVNFKPNKAVKEVVVYGLRGQKILHKKRGEANFDQWSSTFDSGIYLVQWLQENGTYSIQRLMVVN